MNIAELRHQLKRQRNALPAHEQHTRSQHSVKYLVSKKFFRAARHIALYYPFRGEIDITALRQHAYAHQHFYLPVLTPFKNNHLWFIEWHSHTRFRKNRFGINEPYPLTQTRRAANALDVVLMPLVAFDETGTRLGMGGGFYDRTFAFKRLFKKSKPVLCGVAYAFQQVDNLVRQPWDIPLDAIATDKKLLEIKR